LLGIAAGLSGAELADALAHALSSLLGCAADEVQVVVDLAAGLLNTLELLTGVYFMLMQLLQLSRVALLELLQLGGHLGDIINLLTQSLDLLLQLIDLIHKVTPLELFLTSTYIMFQGGVYISAISWHFFHPV